MATTRFLLQLALVFAVLVASSLQTVTDILDVKSDVVIQEAQFAFEELKKLSDSRIYETLSITQIISATYEIGIFHENTIMKIELSSPYFKSGLPTEEYNMVVMRHKEDGIRSFAIDEFPEMDELAIEQFWIEKVEDKRVQREEAVRRLEIEAILLGETPSYTDKRIIEMKMQIDKQPVRDLLRELDTTKCVENRSHLSKERQKRIKNEVILADERELETMTLEQLFSLTVSRSNADVSDYQKYRAGELLDASMLHLQHLYHGKDEPSKDEL
jgi:hypothetical protein